MRLDLNEREIKTLSRSLKHLSLDINSSVDGDTLRDILNIRRRIEALENYNAKQYENKGSFSNDNGDHAQVLVNKGKYYAELSVGGCTDTYKNRNDLVRELLSRGYFL